MYSSGTVGSSLLLDFTTIVGNSTEIWEFHIVADHSEGFIREQDAYAHYSFFCDYFLLLLL